MGTLVLAGATSGSTTLTPVDAVTTVLTLPSATATLATLGANTFTGNQSITGTLGVTGTSTLAAVNASSSITSTGGAFAALSNGQSRWYSSSVVGMVLYGQGSSNDFYMLNSAGQLVFAVGAGTTAVTIPGTMNFTGTGDQIVLLDTAATGGSMSVRANGNVQAGYMSSVDNGANLFFAGARKDTTGGSSGTARWNLLYNATNLIAVSTAGAVTIPGTLGVTGAAIIGDTADNGPGQKLYVKQTSGATTAVSALHNTATTGDNVFLSFGTEAGYTTRGSITYNRAGGLTVYNTTSDYRSKDITGKYEASGETIDQLQVYMGKMKGATIARPMMIAHEAASVVPYAVTGEKDAVDDKGEPIYQSMDHQIFVPLLIAEVQSLRSRLAALESK